MQYETVQFASIEVCYTPDLDGGGMTFGQDYLERVRRSIGPVERIFEWCAGPGFIGFSLLAHGLCQSLCLADINPKAVRACTETITRNNLHHRVNVYQANCFDGIPASERWDLVVGNPPHFGAADRYAHLGPHTLYMDPEWELHRRFYREVKAFLAPNAHVLIQEHAGFSRAETFRPMIEDGGLVFVGERRCQLPSRIYYVWSAINHKSGHDGARTPAESTSQC